MKIIDNKKITLAEVLNREFPEQNEIAIATAYFNIMGYRAISEGLGDKQMKLLLGREPTERIKWEDEILRELEEFEDDPEYFKTLQKAIQYFKSEKREVRLIEGRFFHGKAYIGVSPSIKNVRRGIGIVGSSNFTYGGLVTNRELNMLNTDREVVQELCEWFEEQWGSGKEYKDEFISLLSNYSTTWSPYEVAAKALYEAYKGSLMQKEEKLLKNLFPHQQLTYIDAMAKLEKYGGVVIADSTGLGKSRVALAIAHEFIRQGIRPLLIAPKAILDTTWEGEMRSTLVRVETISMEMLSQNPEIVENFIGENGPKLIIVDEAHYFRRASTNRYLALQNLILKNKAKVVLMTATPINTKLMDLYSLFSLYLPDDAIADMGYHSLRNYFVLMQKNWLEGKPIDMDEVLRRFMVRHSRDLAKILDREGKIRFPKRLFDEKLERYPIPVSLQEIDEALEKLKMPYYDLSIEKLSANFMLPDGKKLSEVDPKLIENLKNLVKTIFKISLFKRLESSFEAFRKTVERTMKYAEVAKLYAENHGIFIPPRLKGDILKIFNGELDDESFFELPSPEELFKKDPRLKEKCKLDDEEKKEFVKACESDIEIYRELIKKVEVEDKKFEFAEKRIEEIFEQLTDSQGLIIFTQFADTAHYLYSKLKDLGRVTLVTGSGAIVEGKARDESEAVEYFRRNGGILISTDVLSAGQNLQNAQFIMNYDFPWNPVVIIQRIGRIDRIGSPYSEVYILNLLPKNGDPDDPESLEYFLNLIGRLYQRLEMIRETIGLEASTLGEEAAPKDFSLQLRLAKNDSKVLEVLEKQMEQFIRDPIDILVKILGEKGLDWVQKIPSGIGAIKDANFKGLFVLFTDGKDFFWRLHDFSNDKIISSPNEIVDLLLEGDSEQKGESIPYEELVNLLRQVKDEMKKEIEKKILMERTRGPRADKLIRELYDALSLSGEEGERLAAMFRKVTNQATVVRTLQDAYRKEGIDGLLKKAKEILPIAVLQEKFVEREEPKKLKRVCWCYFREVNH